MTLFKKAVRGAMAGLAAAQVMQLFRSAWNASSGPRDGVFGLDPEADLNSVNALATHTVGRSLPESEAVRIALALHYAYGAAAGVAYSLAAEKAPVIRSGFGTAFGITVWLIGDELAMTVSGFSDPRSKSFRSHASAAFAHLLFGLATELSLRAIGTYE